MEVKNILSLSIKKISKSDREDVFNIIKGIENFNFKDKLIACELIDECLNYDTGEYLIYCALEKDKILGYICYGEASLTEGTYEVYYIAVDKKHQRKGVGQYLMMEIEKKLSGICRMILIETSSDYTYNLTQKFYEKQGYKEIFRIKDFYKEKEDKIIYQKKLK